MAACTFLAITGSVFPLAVQSNNLQQTSNIRITATTNIYAHWACDGPAAVDAARGEPVQSVLDPARGIRIVSVMVAVGQIECHSGTLNKSLCKALKEREHLNVRFNVHKYEITNKGNTAKVSGEFMIGGVGRPVEFDAKLTPVPRGGVQIEGELGILMTHYGIKPPKVFLGMFRVRDNITIKFDICAPGPKTVIAETRY